MGARTDSNQKPGSKAKLGKQNRKSMKVNKSLAGKANKSKNSRKQRSKSEKSFRATWLPINLPSGAEPPSKPAAKSKPKPTSKSKAKSKSKAAMKSSPKTAKKETKTLKAKKETLRNTKKKGGLTLTQLGTPKSTKQTKSSKSSKSSKASKSPATLKFAYKGNEKDKEKEKRGTMKTALKSKEKMKEKTKESGSKGVREKKIDDSKSIMKTTQKKKTKTLPEKFQLTHKLRPEGGSSRSLGSKFKSLSKTKPRKKLEKQEKASEDQDVSPSFSFPDHKRTELLERDMDSESINSDADRSVLLAAKNVSKYAKHLTSNMSLRSVAASVSVPTMRSPKFPTRSPGQSIRDLLKRKKHPMDAINNLMVDFNFDSDGDSHEEVRRPSGLKPTYLHSTSNIEVDEEEEEEEMINGDVIDLKDSSSHSLTLTRNVGKNKMLLQRSRKTSKEKAEKKKSRSRILRNKLQSPIDGFRQQEQTSFRRSLRKNSFTSF